MKKFTFIVSIRRPLPIEGNPEYAGRFLNRYRNLTNIAGISNKPHILNGTKYL